MKQAKRGVRVLNHLKGALHKRSVKKLHSAPEVLFKKVEVTDGSVLYRHNEFKSIPLELAYPDKPRGDNSPKRAYGAKSQELSRKNRSMLFKTFLELDTTLPTPKKKFDRSKLTEETVSRVKKLRDEGYSLKQVSSKLSVPIWIVGALAPSSEHKLKQIKLADEQDSEAITQRRKRNPVDFRNRGENAHYRHQVNQVKWRKSYIQDGGRINNWILRYNTREDPRYTKKSWLESFFALPKGRGLPHFVQRLEHTPQHPPDPESLIKRWYDMGYTALVENEAEQDDWDSTGEDIGTPSPPKIRV